MPIWLPRIWLPEAPGWTRMPCAPLPQMMLFSCGLLPPTVVLDEFRTTPCWALPLCCVKATLPGAGKGAPVVGVHGVGVVIADGVALDEVADHRIA